MTSLVLIHGSWTGGWLWTRVAAELAGRGHRVLAPDLLGLGQRTYLAGPATGLRAQVEDLVAVLEAQDVCDGVLVGHSYAGMLLADVASRASRSIRQLVYVDAFLPYAGEAAFDLVPGLEARFLAATDASRWRVAVPDYRRYGPLADADLEWLQRSSVPMPMRTHAEPADSSAPAGMPATYVGCSGYAGMRPMLARAAAGHLRCLEWPDVGHLPMVSHPHRLAAVLCDLATENK